MIDYSFNQSDAKTYCGIYRIHIGEHTYIGSTKRAIWVRIKEHERALLKNKHYNKKMQYWYNKIWDIKFEVLEYCESYCVWEREQFYINKLNPDINIVKRVARY